MTIEMLDTESESQTSEQGEEGNNVESATNEAKQHSAYVERFLQPGESVSEECKEHLAKRPVFLLRGIRSYAKSPFGRRMMEKDKEENDDEEEEEETEEEEDKKEDNPDEK